MSRTPIRYAVCPANASDDRVRASLISRADIPARVSGTLSHIGAYRQDADGYTLLAGAYYDEATAHEDGCDIHGILDDLDRRAGMA